MVAAVESMAWTGQVPWHREGVEVDNNLTPHEMMVAAGLDWTVSKRPLYTLEHAPEKYEKDDEGNLIVTSLTTYPDRFSIMRDTDNQALGTCSADYQPIQNERIFDFFQKFAKHAKITMETAGSLRDGKDIFALARLNDNFALPGGDELQPFVLFRQPHEPGYAMNIMDTEIRVVCSNTLQLALRGANVAQYKMSHRLVFDELREEQALKTMGAVYERRAEFKEAAEFLAKTKAKDGQVIEFISKLYQPKILEEHKPEDGPLRDGFSSTAKTVYEALATAPGADLKSAQGTWWGAVNAVTFVEDHKRTGDNRVYNAMFGDASTRKTKALNLAIEYAKAA